MPKNRHGLLNVIRNRGKQKIEGGAKECAGDLQRRERDEPK
jgi:hypothetical protein